MRRIIGYIFLQHDPTPLNALVKAPLSIEEYFIFYLKNKYEKDLLFDGDVICSKRSLGSIFIGG